jgi:hypothetical protein
MSLTGARGPRHSYRFLILLSVLGFAAHNSYAIPPGGEMVMSGQEFFNTYDLYAPKRIDARVLYEVIRYDDGDDYEYLYTYRVSNESAFPAPDDPTYPVKLELFSIGISEGADAYSPGFEHSLDGDEVAPTALYVVGDPPQSVTFLFLLEPLDAGQYSTLLTFWSDDAPDMEYGTLFGGGISQVGSLPAPVPEPGSILLLGAGALSAFVGKATSSKRHK